MIPDRSLVNTPEANEFVDNAKLETQRNSMLGSLNRFRNDFKDDPEIYNRVSACHQVLHRAAETITRLASDGSRNEVEKHAAAKKVADDTIVQLDNTRQSLLGLSESYMRGVDDRLTEVFKLPEPRVSSTHEDSKEFTDILAQVTYNHPGKRNSARSKQ